MPAFAFLNKQGEIVNHKFFYKSAKSFSEGFAAVQKPIDKQSDDVGKWGFINTQFEETTAFIYEDAKSFSNGLAAVCNFKRMANGDLLILMVI